MQSADWVGSYTLVCYELFGLTACTVDAAAYSECFVCYPFVAGCGVSIVFN